MLYIFVMHSINILIFSLYRYFPKRSNEPSSSSSIEEPSSSSSEPSSSSESLCADFVEGEVRDTRYNYIKKNFCDERDGKKYFYVEIGEQTWMAENLNYNVEGRECLDDCERYGRLYDWSTAMGFPERCNGSPQANCLNLTLEYKDVCPDGWHIPGYDDWAELLHFVSKDINKFSCGDNPSDTPINCSGLGQYLTARSNGSSNDYDKYGFSALLDGNSYNGDAWWSAKEFQPNRAFYMGIRQDGVVFLTYNQNMNMNINKTNPLHVRCLKDNDD